LQRRAAHGEDRAADRRADGRGQDADQGIVGGEEAMGGRGRVDDEHAAVAALALDLPTSGSGSRSAFPSPSGLSATIPSFAWRRDGRYDGARWT